MKGVFLMKPMKRLIEVDRLFKELTEEQRDKMRSEWVPQVGDFFTLKSSKLSVHPKYIVIDDAYGDKDHYMCIDQFGHIWEQSDILPIPDLFLIFSQFQQIYHNQDWAIFRECVYDTNGDGKTDLSKPPNVEEWQFHRRNHRMEGRGVKCDEDMTELMWTAYKDYLGVDINMEMHRKNMLLMPNMGFVFPTYQVHGTMTGRFDSSKENQPSKPRPLKDITFDDSNTK